MASLKTSELQVGMKVKDNILGARGDVKVNKGEVLSKMHIDKLNQWNKTGLVDQLNPRGFETESTIKSGSDIPAVIDRPDLSPVIQGQSKAKLQSQMSVPIDIKDGKVIRYDAQGNPIPDEPIEIPKEEVKTNAVDTAKPKGKPGRPKSK